MKFDATNILLSIIIAGLGWLLVQQYETKAAVSAVETTVSALPPKWLEDRVRENSDDIDDMRNHKHSGINIAMLDRYEDE